MAQLQVLRRRSLRLPGYDYSQPGAYFITVCTRRRALLFEAPQHRDIVVEAWQDLPNHYLHVALDAFVVMPNHVHGILVLTENHLVGAGFKPAPTTTSDVRSIPMEGERHHGLPEIVRGFKTFSARRINALRRSPVVPVWQRSYYEHIVRSEDDLQRIREYICSNPARWAYDGENPGSTAIDEAEAAMWQLLGEKRPGVAALRDK